MTDVDLSQLAVERKEVYQSPYQSRHWFVRYAFPGVLVCGFSALILWSSAEFFFPARKVKVVPVFATQAEVRTEGAELFKAAGWIEPRPTAIRVAAAVSTSLHGGRDRAPGHRPDRY